LFGFRRWCILSSGESDTAGVPERRSFTSRLERLTGDREVPRYEYKCRKCDRNFDVIHGVDDTVEECKFCGSEVRRVFHPVGIVFKGSGFYATDSRGGSKALQPSRDEKEPAASSSGNGKEEKKPAADSKKDTAKSST